MPIEMQAFGLFVTVAFVAYVVAIAVPYLRHRPAVPADPSVYTWHFFVPCRDEETVVGETLETLRLDFPDAHVWIIDDDSDDATAAIVRAAAAADDRVHLVTRRRPDARTGKGPALNAAYRALCAWLPPGADRAAAVVAVVDADGVLDTDALAYVAGTEGFAAGDVGAVQIGVRMVNRDEPEPRPDRGRVANTFARLLVRLQDLEFATTIAAMQFLRVHCESVGLGGNGQFTRLAMLDHIAAEYGTPWHGAVLEDYELGLHALLVGWKVRYIHDVAVEQEGLVSLRRLITQRTRWSQGNMQCARYLPKILGSPRLTMAGAMETSYYLILPFVQVLGAILWPILIAGTLSDAVASGGSLLSWTSQWWLLGLLTLTFGVLPFAVWGPIYKLRCEPQAGWVRAVGWGLAHWLYVYYMYVCNVRAFWRFARGKGGWLKTRRNAEVRRPGSIALEA